MSNSSQPQPTRARVKKAPKARTPVAEADAIFAALDFSELPQLVSVRQLAQFLGVGRHVVYTLVAEGELQAIKVSEHSIRIFRESIRLWLKHKCDLGTPELPGTEELESLD